MEMPSFSDKGWWEFLNLPEEKPTCVSEHQGIGEPGTMDLAAVQTTVDVEPESGATSRHVHFQPQSSKFLDVEKNQMGVESYPWPSPACEINV